MNNTIPMPFYSKESLEEPIVIGIARTPEEKREIYRLRYHIYGEEIPFKLVSVDHENKLLYDDLDEWCTLFYAKIGLELVGTVRVNIGQLADFSPEIAEAYCMERFQKFYNNNEYYNFGLASKGMVSSSYRNLPVFTMLMTKVFEVYCDDQVHFGFANTNFHLLPLHEYYGHRRIGKNIVDPNLGLLASLVIIPDDIHHLQIVQSPFLKIARKRKIQNDQIIEWFFSEFPETANIINSQLVTKESFWTTLRVRLGNCPNEVMPILQGLSKTEAKQFLHYCGVVVQCSKGNYIVTREDACQELNILISGTVQSSDVNGISLGQHFGAIGLANRTKHTANIIAATDTEILVLSFHYFQKLRRSCPEIANRILHNLASLQKS
ncbi:Crp/Fnr family transcriptional regulator [Pelosinus baikalensis]|uniref:Cyclic nucleotide-binding domain-containing protein n=1 Tax=Pelosinus baikalensis TaxID=2892015 RepID=A0ABS8HYC1_9FIRM|nr:cyclic nucleotide-binding domain-containing protein [Pelosinus baikalensis]MCC5468010.1 cyclic nucleotide-binding domain-containing protein [Pelosinus baikalensis]